jgi:hypothetical protein
MGDEVFRSATQEAARPASSDARRDKDGDEDEDGSRGEGKVDIRWA